MYEFVGVADAPTSVVATQGDLETTVSWDAPVHDGGEPISSYTITGSADDATCTWTSGPLECSITGLTIGDTYSFTVTANTANGNGLTSTSSNTITFAGVPDAPTNLTVEASDGEASLSWNQPDSNGSPITGYTATANPSGANCTTTNTTCTIDGLTNGTTYTFSVTASNAIGSSTASTEASATPGLSRLLTSLSSRAGRFPGIQKPLVSISRLTRSTTRTTRQATHRYNLNRSLSSTLEARLSLES